MRCQICQRETNKIYKVSPYGYYTDEVCEPCYKAYLEQCRRKKKRA